jgi:hypothetical protein
MGEMGLWTQSVDGGKRKQLSANLDFVIFERRMGFQQKFGMPFG